MDGVPTLMDSSGQLDCSKRWPGRFSRPTAACELHPLIRPSAPTGGEGGRRLGEGVIPRLKRAMRAQSPGRSLREPAVLRVADPRSGTRLCEAHRFIAPTGTRRLLGRLVLVLLLLCVFGRLPLLANDVASNFETANKLYEQGKFAEAAASYQKILQTGRVSAALYFNFGNALFKSGQVGRAILNFRLAEQLAPRDPDIRANLQFARNSVGDGGGRAADRWRRWVHRLTLNEWTAVTVAALWLWFGLLVAGQCRPGFKRSSRGYTAITGATVLLLGIGLGLAFYDRFHTLWAVVVTPEAVVRYGPLEESQGHYKLRDGAEVIVTDRQNNWLEVVDSVGRKGWLRRDQVVSLREPADQQSLHSERGLRIEN